MEEIEKIIKINLITIEKKLPIVKEKTEVFREKHKTLDAELSKHIIVEDEIAANVTFNKFTLLKMFVLFFSWL